MAREFPMMKALSSIKECNIIHVREIFQSYPENVNDHTFMAGKTWVSYAAYVGSVEMISELVKLGADVNKGDKHDDANALHAAASAGQLAAVDYLIQHKVDVVVSNSTKNPLIAAIIAQSLDVAKRLVDAGIDTTKRYVFGDKSNPSLDAVAFAMMHGQREIAHMIALHNSNGNEELAQTSMAEGLALAEQITTLSDDR